MARRRETSSVISATPEQIGEVVSPIMAAVLRTSSDRLQYWVSRKKKLQREVAQILGGSAVPDYGPLLADWQKFYREVYGLTVDLSGVRVPEPQEGFDRLIVVPQGLTLNRAFAACKEAFPSWRYADDLDMKVIKNDRDPQNGSYAVWARNRREADDELKNCSANDLAKRGGAYITLLERLVYERKYFAETNQHLDVQNITLCAGSRDAHGGVPYVGWGGAGLHVGWYSPGGADDDLRARAVVP